MHPPLNPLPSREGRSCSSAERWYIVLLLIDAGNTNIKICLYDDRVTGLFKLETDKAGTGPAEELSEALNDLLSRQKSDKPEGAVISSVVTDATSLLADAVRRRLGTEPVIVDHTVRTGLKLLVKNPEEIGADRLANAAAANKLYEGNKIVVDLGTATTFCVVTEEGGFRGGVIMAGPDISAGALADRTSRLPGVDLKLPSKILGDNTTDAMLSGIIIGHAGAVERVLKGIENETGMDYTVIMTGGRADLIAPLVGSIDHVVPDLTFKGLKIIYELNP
jgi:type III pantothenate kinase